MNVVMRTTLGDITIALDEDKAPRTVDNFLAYVQDGYFAGTLFHRVIPGFMIQGGGLTPGLRNKPGRPPIDNEAANGLANRRGSIAMARTNDPHSATSQFFINVADNGFLNHTAPNPRGWGYCVFGQVTAGMEVVDRIVAVATTSRQGHENVPVEDILIESVEIADA